MYNFFYYVSTIVILYTMSFDVKAGMIEDLQEKGDAKVVTPCVVRGEKLTCIVIAYEGSVYSVAGVVDGSEFYAKFIAKNIDGKWLIVWVYGTDV